MDTAGSKLPFWETLESGPLWKPVLWVFLFGLAERLIVSLVLFHRWGWHTVSGIELWFYYGVAKGTFALYSAFDPSCHSADIPLRSPIRASVPAGARGAPRSLRLTPGLCWVPHQAT